MGATKDELASSAWQRMFELFQSRKDEFVTIAAEAGLTPAHMHALLSLDPDEPKPMRSLAAEWKCDASNVTFLADRLEEAGYVERRVSPTDRRVKILQLTHAGHGARATLLQRMSEPPPALLELTAAELRTLDELLARVDVGDGLLGLGPPGSHGPVSTSSR